MLITHTIPLFQWPFSRWTRVDTRFSLFSCSGVVLLKSKLWSFVSIITRYGKVVINFFLCYDDVGWVIRKESCEFLSVRWLVCSKLCMCTCVCVRVEDGVVVQRIAECFEHSSKPCHHRWPYCWNAAVCLVRVQGIRTHGRRLRSFLRLHDTALQPAQLLWTLLQVQNLPCD